MLGYNGLVTHVFEIKFIGEKIRLVPNEIFGTAFKSKSPTFYDLKKGQKARIQYMEIKKKPQTCS